MTLHDQELRLYNDIMHRFEQMEEEMQHIYSSCHDFDKIYVDRLFLVVVWCKDAKDKFQKYSELIKE